MTAHPRPERLRFGVLALLVCAVGWTGFSSPAPSPTTRPADWLGPRLKIQLFKYAGADGDAGVQFSRFKGLLRDKLTVSVERLLEKGPGFSYLDKLSLEPSSDGGLDDTFTNEASAREFWTNSHSLLLLRGTIGPSSQSHYIAQTRLFLFDLKGKLSHPSISVDLPIESDQVRRTTDTHSLAFHYALAMDAIRMHADRALVMALLSRAEDAVRDLRSQGSLDAAVTELADAVDASIREQRGPSP